MISINIYEIAMQMINFIILLVLVNKFLVKPMGDFLKERASDIKENIDQAEKGRQESDALLAQQKELLKQARVEAQQIRQNAEEATKKEKEMIVSQAKQESEKILSDARKEIEQDVAKVKQDLINQSGLLAVNLTESILKKTMSEQDKQGLISDSLEMLKQR